MKGLNNQIWLTTVLHDKDVDGALVLCASLKHVWTNRHVGVLVASQISPHLRTVLRRVFDHVFHLEECFNKLQQFGDYARLFPLTLHSFEKIVVLSRTLMVIKNCDELFQENVEYGFNKDKSVMIIRPNLNLFFHLMSTRNCNWINQNGSTIFNENYFKVLGSTQDQWPNEEISIVNLTKIMDKIENEFDDSGLIEKQLVLKWKQLHMDMIQPLITGNTLQAPLDYRKEPIAIVGMSCRYPDADNLDQFWEIMISGKDGTKNPPDYRWTPNDTTRGGYHFQKTNAGFLKTQVTEFDSKFFGISGKEMVFIDPQHRLLQELVWEGLEDAAINPDILRGTNGSVFIGSWTNDYKAILKDSITKEFYREYMGNSIGAAAARLSFMLGMTGPSIATESACASAMVAVHLACKSLQREETSVALACGVNLLLHPFDETDMPMVLSPEGRCKTFDVKADGFCRAEGCGVLVLKRLSDAVKDEDRIWGLIRGTGVSQEGVSKSMGTPTVYCESLAMKLALEDAQVQPEMVSYIETHGTGTPVGDPMEVAAVADAYHSKNRTNPLIIGSVKTNVGHTESCSGITGIMKVILAMKNEMIPAHRNLDCLNPAINLDAVPALIPLEPIAWNKLTGQPRFAGVSSFGITGTDAHVIIEECPNIPSNRMILNDFERPMHILTVSAKNEESLDILLDKYKTHVETSQDSLSDITFTANTGRQHFSSRSALITSSRQELITKLTQQKVERKNKESTEIGKICFLFPGQGTQYPGMAKLLYETSPIFQIHFDACDKILQKNHEIRIKPILYDYTESNKLSQTIYSQTAIFCVEYSLLQLWLSWGVKPDFCLGHSLGEFCAAICAGILTLEDAIKLVAERSRLIEALPQGKMLVIKSNKQNVAQLMTTFGGNDSNKIMDYAAINSKDQTVVAGDSSVVIQFSTYLGENGIKYTLLDSTHAFHSKHMDPILNEYEKIADTMSYKNITSNCQFISGMSGDVIQASNINSKYWTNHCRQPVEFIAASKKAVDLGCTMFIEIGPHPVLSALIMNAYPNTFSFPSIKRNEPEWNTLATSLTKLYVNGVDINWSNFEKLYPRKKVSLPHYPFQRKRFWPDLTPQQGVSIHPLIGSPIANASSTKIFNCGVNLNNFDYLKDHSIGQHVIFPGAGYLEMCLAAGIATIHDNVSSMQPQYPVKIENLGIEAPLCLPETGSCLLQSVVDYRDLGDNDSGDLSIKIYHRQNSAGSDSVKWIRHANGIFSSLPTPEDKQVPVDYETFQKIILEPSNSPDLISTLYEKLASIGLKFGPTFQTMESIWKNKEGNIVLKIKNITNSDESLSYIMHPTIIDAMLQAIMVFQITEFKKKLFVPIKIGKFVWLSGVSKHSTLFIHVSSDLSSPKAVLLNSLGDALAIMTSVEFIDTTAKALESVLDQQLSSMPSLWEQIWCPQPNPFKDSIDLARCNESFSLDEVKADINTFKVASPKVEKMFQSLEGLCELYTLQSLYHCGWCPSGGEIFLEENLFSELRIQSIFRQWFGFVLKIFGTLGYLQRVENNSPVKKWQVIEPPSLSQVKLHLSSKIYENLSHDMKFTLLYQKIGENLAKIITGEMSPLVILFPDASSGLPSVSDLYNEMGLLNKKYELTKEVLKYTFQPFQPIMHETKSCMRILEIGAGTGEYTQAVLESLEFLQLKYEYTFTDISPAFFVNAQKRFEQYLPSMTFKKFNAEEDPLTQGFVPEHYDYVIAAEVLHCTKDIRESLQNLRLLLRPGGKLAVFETTGEANYLTFLFGLLEGYWRFEDHDLRIDSCTMSLNLWQKALISSGFAFDGEFLCVRNTHSVFGAQKTLENCQFNQSNKTWVIFTCPGQQLLEDLAMKMKRINRSVVKVTWGNSFTENDGNFTLRHNCQEDFKQLFYNLTNNMQIIEGILYCWPLDKNCTTQDTILQPFFHLTKSLLEEKVSNPKLIVVTQGAVPIGNANEDISQFEKGTLWGYTKSLKHENIEMHIGCVDIDYDTTVDEVFYEIWDKTATSGVVYRNGTRYISKFHSFKGQDNELKIPNCASRYQLILPESKSISDLEFGPLPPENVGETQIEIQVQASALNFKDILNILKPTEEFKNSNAVGFDYAGVVQRVGKHVTKWSVGDPVFGINIHGNALPSHVVCGERDVNKVPNNMTLCEAATLPAVVATAYHCLIEVAKIKSSDTVLIHTASGGVGLAAIQLCQHVGCTIIATAGSKRKQTYLRSLGIQHIFHSRNTKYEIDILQVTNDRGVDVVLNSLTSEGFKEATLKACAKNARFVEMSKLSIWKPEEVKNLRPDVEYTIVDLSAMKPEQWRNLLNKLKDLVDKKVVKPCPFVRFNGGNIRQALQYLQKGKHIGKVVCTLPQMKSKDNELVSWTPIFNDRSTYLVTGGLGGIGWEICKWMVSKGAKFILLASRSLPKAEMQKRIEEINTENGCNVMAVQLNVGNYENCRDLIEVQINAKSLPPLRGIMHAAGTLQDGLVRNQTWDKLSSTLCSKVDGSWNLHRLTCNMNLEHFVVFSSMAALFGPPGQSNHAAGNLYEDNLCHYRHSLGLPAATLNFGQWGQVGVATEIEFPGLQTISTLQGISAVEYVLKMNMLQTIVVNVESFILMSRLLPNLKHYVDERLLKSASGSSTTSVAVKSGEFWEEYDKKSDHAEKSQIVEHYVRNILRDILKVDDTESLNENANFQDLGVDSLMFVEIKNALQSLLGERVVISTDLLQESNSIKSLCDAIIKVIHGDGNDAENSNENIHAEVINQ